MISSNDKCNEIDLKSWDEICTEVTKLMQDHLKPYVTPISKVIDVNYGEHLGSGSFLSDNGLTYLITNEHVAKELKSTPLAHQLLNADEVLRILNPFCALDYPVDVALTMISGMAWSAYKHGSQGIPLNRFSINYQPILGELLFMIGYSGERSSFHYETLITAATPYLCQEIELPKDYGDPKYHFAIDYKPDLAISTDGSSRGLPTPPGLSGSLVWNTRFKECSLKGEKWSPEKAEVIGIVWGWPSSAACLIATKVEYLSIRDLVLTAKSLAKIF